MLGCCVFVLELWVRFNCLFVVAFGTCNSFDCWIYCCKVITRVWMFCCSWFNWWWVVACGSGVLGVVMLSMVVYCVMCILDGVIDN